MNTYRLSQNSCNPYYNSLHASKFCEDTFCQDVDNVTEDVWSKTTPFCTVNSQFSSWRKHNTKHCLGCGCCASFSFLFILFKGVTVFLSLFLPPSPPSLTRTCAHRKQSKMWTPFQRYWQGHSQQFTLLPVQSLPFMCHVNLASTAHTLCTSTNFSSLIQSTETILGWLSRQLC
jgi:hypothetical protein